MRGLLVFVLLVAAWPATAAPDLRAMAKHRFEEGKREFDAQHYAAALKLFEESYADAPYPALLFNIARCQEELDQLAEAIDNYERYLVVQPEAELRQKVDMLRVRLAAEPVVVAPVLSPSPSPEIVVAPAILPLVVVTARPAPLYRRWWPWTIGVVVAVGVGLGIGLGLGLHGDDVHRFPPLTGGAP